MILEKRRDPDHRKLKSEKSRSQMLSFHAQMASMLKHFLHRHKRRVPTSVCFECVYVTEDRGNGQQRKNGRSRSRHVYRSTKKVSKSFKKVFDRRRFCRSAKNFGDRRRILNESFSFLFFSNSQCRRMRFLPVVLPADT